MYLAKKLAKVFSLIFLTNFIASCDPGCVEANEFDKAVITVDSYPIKDGIQGVGDTQVAQWHDTGLKTTGGKIVVEITGAWTPWYGNDDLGGNAQLTNLQACSFCARSAIDPSNTNCICYKDQTPVSESGYAGGDCASNSAAQNDPAKCSCTTYQGSATDYGVYHFPLNQYNKNHDIILADYQSPCKYHGGMGLFMGLFGGSGNATPIRAYHLFSQTAVCDVVRNSEGKCLDADTGMDVTKYIFTSANDQIFVKDDNSGNLGPDLNPSADTMHTRNEQAKLIILDSSYEDNFGTYQISFLSGVGDPRDSGLLEFLVSLIEDKIIGTPDANGVRQGGVIQAMFNDIVQDSGFISILQMGLSFYIIFYGFATLIGVAEITKKELMTRALKIALVIFFTSKTSWYWYDKFVVGFFKDGMDSVITMFMNFSDKNIDPTSGIVTAQMDRAALNSSATRFSYADLIIRNLLSTASATKIFGLFFGVPLFGIVYIVLIYGLIAFFLYVMLTVAMMYAVAITKLAFVLALGPIFIAFTLSQHTNGMFKKWLAFIGSRSLEIIILFLVLYNFLVLIDQNFTALLSYRACVTQLNLWLFSIPIVVAKVDRSLITWFSAIVKLGGLIFITKLVVDKISDIAGSLITIGGESGSGGTSEAGGMLGGLIGAAQSAMNSELANNIANRGVKALQGAGGVASGAVARVGGGISGVVRSTEAGNQAMNAANKVFSMMPSNPRAMYRNSIIDSAISNAQKEATSKGLTGEKANQYVRSAATAAVTAAFDGKGAAIKNTTMGNAPKIAALVGLDLGSIGKRLDQQLIDKPLVDFIKSETKKLKESPNAPIGKEMRNAINAKIDEWTAKNAPGRADYVKDLLSDRGRVVNGISMSGVSFNNMHEFIRNQSEYTAAEAAKAFKDNPGKQQEYLQHLQMNAARLEDRKAQGLKVAKEDRKAQELKVAKSAGYGELAKNFSAAYQGMSGLVRAVKPLDNLFGNDALNDPARASASFQRKVSNAEIESGGLSDIARAKTGSWLKHNQGSALNPFNLMKSKAAIGQEIREGDRSGLIRYLSGSGAEKEQAAITQNYNKKIATQQIEGVPNNSSYEFAMKSKREEKIGESQRRREIFKDRLKDLAIKSTMKDAETVRKNLEEIEKLNASTRNKYAKQSFDRITGNAKNSFDSESRKAQDVAIASKAQEIEKERERIRKLDFDNSVKKDPKVDQEIAKGQEKIEKLAKENADAQIKRDSLEAQRAFNSKKLEESNAALEVERQKEIKEIAKLKLENKSLEELVKEIKKLESNYDTKESLALRAMGKNPDEQKELDREFAKEMQVALERQLQSENTEAFVKHAKKQREFLQEDQKKIVEDNLASIAKLKEMYAEDGGNILLKQIYSAQDEARLALNTFDPSQLSAADLAKVGNSEHGGAAALKDGLTEIDNTTLFEKEARLKYYQEQFAVKEGSGSDEAVSNVVGGQSSATSVDLGGASTGSPPPVDGGSVATLSPEALLIQEQVSFENDLGAINDSIDVAKVSGDETALDKALEDLKKLENHPAASPANDDHKDSKSGGSSSGAVDKSALKSNLSNQASVLKTRIVVVKAKSDKAKNELARLKSDKADVKEIETVELLIRNLEAEEGVLKDRSSLVESEIAAIDA